jgi:hypothetical protein
MNSGADTLAGGFPHSEIRGSTIARISPQLIAACHVLHRLLAPRHPPNALIALNTYHQCPHAGPNPTMQSSAYQTNELRPAIHAPAKPWQSRSRSNSASLIHSFVHDTTIPHKALAPHSTAGLVTNQSDSPVKHHASRIRSPQEPITRRQTRCAAAQHPARSAASRPSTHQTYSFGDGRYRTDGPLLAKQVLYH